ncbi:hypothetical protein [Novosphingobium sp. 9]|uniref:hypothetical protein n=1 Tax=Novosphingobium sp. 9 TaxID=2025349 RepID=UPI0021B5D29B|nr:hypothetical protein [Novosphingobium sp. 9]
MTSCNPFTQPRNPAYKRYARRMAVSAVLYTGAIVAASSLLHKHSTASVGTIAIALLPGLAVLGMLWSIARLFLELDDEYLRMLEVRKAMIATGLTLAICSVWGILEIYTNVPRLPLFFVFPLWAVCLFAGMAANAWGTRGGAK